MLKGVRRNKFAKLLSKFIFALAMSLFFVLLGTFDGLGYHVHEIEEISFIPNQNYGYADAVFRFDATFNPILYPFYWLLGKGHTFGQFSMIYLPTSYERGDFGPAIYGDSPEDRFGKYVSFMVTWGTWANFGFLLAITTILEILKRRVLHLSLFLGIFGFSLAGITGMLIGLAGGAIAAVFALKQRYSFSIVGLRGYVIRRTASALLLILIAITVNFIIFMRMPGNPLALFTQPVTSTRLLTENEKAAFIQETRKLWGFDQQVIPQYFTYLRNLILFNFGSMGTTQSVDGKKMTPITQSLEERLPYTIFLLGSAVAISLTVGVLLGIKAIQKRGGKFDQLSSTIPISISCMPVWWIGFLFLTFFGLAIGEAYVINGGGYPHDWVLNPPIVYSLNTSYSSSSLHIIFDFNVQEVLRLIGGYLQYAILPLCTLILSMFGQWALLTRASMLEIIGEDYLLTARAKGLTDWKVLTKHGLKNASLPIITQSALAFPFILTGSVLVESVFRYPGIGAWLFDSIRFNDVPVLMTIFYVIALFVILANIITDLLYGLIDPRINTRQEA